MSPIRISRRSSINWGKGFRIGLTVLALLFLVPAAQTVTTPRAQPFLMQLASDRPDLPVGVIVQKTTSNDAIEQRVAQLGGSVNLDLSIINGFAADIPAKYIPELAMSSGVRWISLDGSIESAASPKKFTTWATKVGKSVPNGFKDADKILSVVGGNRTYGSGGNSKAAFGGFIPEYTPKTAIKKIEVALQLYLSAKLDGKESIQITPSVPGSKTITVPAKELNKYVGANRAGTLYVDIAGARAWKWQDFQNLEIILDQTGLAPDHTIYYDAVGVSVMSTSGYDTTSPIAMPTDPTTGAISASALANVYNRSIRAADVWNQAPYYKGSGVTVAVIDSGAFRTNAIGSRLIGVVNFNSSDHSSSDGYGHGTFVTGLLADDGSYSGGKYVGVAPGANVLSVRVADDYGAARESDVIAGMQWVWQNRNQYNIRVVNISMNSSVYQSYHTSPLDAASEILWFNGVTVVVSAGNNGSYKLYPPANDPFVITVGAVDDRATASIADDTVAGFSAFGVDEIGHAKPDLVAPGKNLIAYLPDSPDLTINVQHPENRVDPNYFRMSGTSMSAPLVSGAAAILISAKPTLNPDQVKARLRDGANKTWAGYTANRAGAGYLDVYNTVYGFFPQTNINFGVSTSKLLWTGSRQPTWGSVDWGSVDWGSVDWGSVDWGSVDWGSVGWGSDFWGN